MKSERRRIIIRIFVIGSVGLACFSSLVKTHAIHRSSDPIIYYSKNQSFEKFLKWTNEKQKIAEEVSKIVGDKKNLLLDIGAGDGSITKLLANKFDYITAIEPVPSLFEALKKKCNSNKYTLINLPFETAALEKKFDTILVSYALQFIPNYPQEIFRIRDLLKDTGLLLIVELDQENCELWKLHRKYRQEVLGTNSPAPVTLDFTDLLKKAFNVQKIFFTATISIPSVDDAISIFDFIYDTEFSKIKKETLVKIRSEMLKDYGDGPLNLKIQQVMYICSK